MLAKFVTIIGLAVMLAHPMSVSLDFEETTQSSKPQLKELPQTLWQEVQKTLPQNKPKEIFQEVPKPQPQRPKLPFPFPAPSFKETQEVKEQKNDWERKDNWEQNIFWEQKDNKEKKDNREQHGSRADGDNCAANLKEARARFNDLVGDLSHLQGQVQSQANEINALRAQNQRLEQENRQLKENKEKDVKREKSRKSEKSGHSRSGANWKAKASALEQQVSTLSNDNKKLFQDNKAFSGILKKIKDDLKLIEGQNIELIAKNKELNEFKTSFGKEKEGLLATIANWERKYETLRLEADRLGKTAGDFAKLKKEFDDLAAERANLLKQIANLNAKIDELNLKIKQLTDENGKLFWDNKGLAEKLKASGDAKRLKEMLDAVVSELEDSRKANDRSLAEIEDLKKVNRSLSARLEILEGNASKDSNDRIKDQIREFKGLIGILEKKIQSLEEERKTFFAQIDSLKKQVRSLTDVISQKDSELADWKSKCGNDDKWVKPSNSQPAFPFLPVVPQPTKEKSVQKSTFIGTSLGRSDLE